MYFQPYDLAEPLKQQFDAVGGALAGTGREMGQGRKIMGALECAIAARNTYMFITREFTCFFVFLLLCILFCGPFGLDSDHGSRCSSWHLWLLNDASYRFVWKHSCSA